jgi:hypothetical protein
MIRIGTTITEWNWSYINNIRSIVGIIRFVFVNKGQDYNNQDHLFQMQAALCELIWHTRNVKCDYNNQEEFVLLMHVFLQM